MISFRVWTTFGLSASHFRMHLFPRMAISALFGIAWCSSVWGANLDFAGIVQEKPSHSGQQAIKPEVVFAKRRVVPKHRHDRKSSKAKPAASPPHRPQVVEGTGALTAKEIYRNYKAAIVSITATQTGEEGTVSRASGFFFVKKDVIATSAHVVRNAARIDIECSDGRNVKPFWIAVDERSDIALLSWAIDPVFREPVLYDYGEPPIAKLGDEVQVGETVFAIGNSLGVLTDSISQGIVSGKRTVSGSLFIQFTAPVSYGNSGGPVFDDMGRIIGIVSSSVRGAQNINLAASMDAAFILAQNANAWKFVPSFACVSRK
jgi:S1-C subfamily serine protease